jgi:hypothetical protein
MALVEMITAMTAALVLVMAVGVLLDGGSRAWLAAYQSAHGKVSEDARTVVASFGSIGRKANRGSYVLYNLSNGTLTPVTAPANQPDGVPSATPSSSVTGTFPWIRPTPTT